MQRPIALVLAIVGMTGLTGTVSGQCRLAFNPTSSVNVAGFPDSLASGDFNLDGKKDLAVVSKNLSSVSILINQGGSFLLTESYDVGTAPSAVAVTDFDNDGKLDLGVTNQDSNTVTLLYGTGLGTFELGGHYNTLPSPTAIVFADFNRDGAQDLAMVHLNIPYITVISGDGARGFRGSQAITHVQFKGGASLAAADINQDGRPDIVGSGLLSSGGFDYEALIVALGNPAGGFGTFSFYSPTGWVAKLTDLKIADVNGDGKPDIVSNVTTTYQGTVHFTLLRGNGTGTFPMANATYDVVAFAGTSISVAVDDFNADGKPDLVFSHNSAHSTDNFFVLPGVGGGTFTVPGTPFGVGGGNTRKLISADFNGDGRPDIASTNSVQNKVSVTFNACSGPGTGAPKADFDGDGKTDLAIFRPSLGEWWYLKSSTGGNAAAQFGVASDKQVSGDFTGDGKTDIAFWRPSTGFWYVLRSEDSSFYAFPFGSNGDVPVTGDYDGDGKIDAAVFRPSNSTWYIKNSSTGTVIQQFGQTGDLPVARD